MHINFLWKFHQNVFTLTITFIVLNVFTEFVLIYRPHPCMILFSCLFCRFWLSYIYIYNTESLKCNTHDGYRATWNVEKLVGMLETGSGLINSNYFGRGHRGTAGGQYDAGIGRGLNRELGGRERAWQVGSHQLINCVYLEAGGTIKSWVGRPGVGVTGWVTSADPLCLPGGRGHNRELVGRARVWQVGSLQLIRCVYLGAGGTIDSWQAGRGCGVGGRVTISWLTVFTWWRGAQ
jgi:hypothetical protein